MTVIGTLSIKVPRCQENYVNSLHNMLLFQSL